MDPIDITEWPRDPDFQVFPQGARAKTAVLAPSGGVLPSKRYLFKYALDRYPEEFWSEIIASSVGRHFGIPVPNALPAIDLSTGRAGALIEWFYSDGVEEMIHGGDLVHREFPGLDRNRKLEQEHNFQLILAVRSRLERDNFAICPTDTWIEIWSRMLFLDALIGNRDRHANNWAILVDPKSIRQGRRPVRIAPAFDNGSSLGREFPEQNLTKTDAWIVNYVERGRHHMRWEARDDKGCPHLDLLAKIGRLARPAYATIRRLASRPMEPVMRDLREFTTVRIPVPLTVNRATFVERILRCRLQRLRANFR